MEVFDVGIIGGGVIGLSIAYEMTRQAKAAGHKLPRVVIVDQPQAGQASWAGAGILPPPPKRATTDPIEQLQRLSLEQFAGWSADLKQQTGIDNQFRTSGGYYLAMSTGEQAALLGLRSYWEEVDIEFQFQSHREFSELEPWLASQIPEPNCRLIGHIPGETQVRNPRHLQALRAACEEAGVEFRNGLVDRLITAEPFVVEIQQQRLKFEQVVLATGSWTTTWLKEHLPEFAKSVSVYPIKGQMLLYQADQVLFDSIVNFGTRYFVPRLDGQILVGSTEEEVGFDAEPTPAVRQELQCFVEATLPAIARLPLVNQWSGFRPASFDQTPIIGRLRGQSNIIVATGHFRSGIQWSIGTAISVVALLDGRQPPIDLQVFAVGR